MPIGHGNSFFGHGKVMENHCWKTVVTLALLMCLIIIMIIGYLSSTRFTNAGPVWYKCGATAHMAILPVSFTFCCLVMLFCGCSDEQWCRINSKITWKNCFAGCQEALNLWGCVHLNNLNGLESGRWYSKDSTGQGFYPLQLVFDVNK